PTRSVTAWTSAARRSPTSHRPDHAARVGARSARPCKGLALQDGRLSASRYSQRDRGNVGSERTVTPAGRRSRVHCQCSAPVACGSVIWDCPADARATDCSVADIGDAWLRSQERQQTMEPLWSPVVAPGGKRPQAVQARGSLKQAKTVAVVAIGSPKAA